MLRSAGCAGSSAAGSAGASARVVSSTPSATRRAAPTTTSAGSIRRVDGRVERRRGRRHQHVTGLEDDKPLAWARPRVRRSPSRPGVAADSRTIVHPRAAEVAFSQSPTRRSRSGATTMATRSSGRVCRTRLSRLRAVRGAVPATTIAPSETHRRNHPSSARSGRVRRQLHEAQQRLVPLALPVERRVERPHLDLRRLELPRLLGLAHAISLSLTALLVVAQPLLAALRDRTPRPVQAATGSCSSTRSRRRDVRAAPPGAARRRRGDVRPAAGTGPASPAPRASTRLIESARRR